MLKIVVFSRRDWQCSEQKMHAHQELLVVDPWSHEFNRTNLSAFLLPGAPLSMVCHQIFVVGMEGTHVDEINLK
jgi:hypothetical protein